MILSVISDTTFSSDPPGSLSKTKNTHKWRCSSYHLIKRIIKIYLEYIFVALNSEEELVGFLYRMMSNKMGITCRDVLWVNVFYFHDHSKSKGLLIVVTECIHIET